MGAFVGIGMSAARAEPRHAKPARRSADEEEASSWHRPPCACRNLHHAKPEMQEQRIVVAGANGGAVELVVESVLKTDAGIGPRPARRLAGAERDIGDFGDETVTVRAKAAGKPRIQDRVGGAPDVEILSGQNDPVVGPIGERCLKMQRAEARSADWWNFPTRRRSDRALETRECSCRAAVTQ